MIRHSPISRVVAAAFVLVLPISRLPAQRTTGSSDVASPMLGFTPDGDNGEGTYGSWTTLYPKKVQRADHKTMAIDPVRDIIFVIVIAANALYALDPNAPAEELVRLSCSRDQPVLAEFAALEYAPNLNRFVYFSAKNGPRLYTITAPD